jgi:CysZ protein
MHAGEMNAAGSGRGSVSRFREGSLLLIEGGRFIRKERQLWPLAMVPVLFATILVAMAAALFWVRLEMIHDAWISVLPVFEATAWWSWIWVGPGKLLFWLVGWLGVVVAFAFSLIAALLLANLLSAPFLDQLSQRVESIEQGESPSGSTGFFGVVKETLRSFAAEFQRIVFLGIIWVGLTGVGFVVPGAHLVTGPLLVATTVLLLPLDYAGFALDRRQISFRSRRRWLWANLPTMTGFGGVAFFACLVPGLNLLIMPALVTAGTLLVLRTGPPDSA